jgi:hypothetical protein
MQNDENFNKAGKGFIAWFIFCCLVGIGMLGIIAWAIISLVTWTTSK